MSHVFAVSSPSARPSRLAASALFDSASSVEHALAQLYNAGVPRDLIEVVVSKEAANRFYPGQRFAPRHDVFRFAGIGGLVGLVLGAVNSLVMLAIAGATSRTLTLFIQLLGPNMLTVVGALLGAVYGAFRRRRVPTQFARAAEASASIVLVVWVRTTAEGAAVNALLSDAGGREARIDAAPKD